MKWKESTNDIWNLLDNFLDRCILCYAQKHNELN